ncbi:hypothetical protein [Legionella sp.]|uniref:hypothetical protein n=1 Tax=Legionella sp. TaxID=459 RepID=UPI000CC35C62|nr:hypothetical protein [Legionella sp.]PJE09550.1 MAG: hypothetical protein CK430_10890 [Legionella sp.]
MKSKIELQFEKKKSVIGAYEVYGLAPLTHYTASYPDSILFRFSMYQVNYALRSRIERAVHSLQGHYQLPVSYSPDSGMHGVPAHQATYFFEMLKNIMRLYRGIFYIEQETLDPLFKSLVANDYLNENQVEQYQNDFAELNAVPEYDGRKVHGLMDAKSTHYSYDVISSRLCPEKVGLVQARIDELNAEISSFYICIHKERKEEKIAGLQELLRLTKFMDVPNAIKEVKENYPQIDKGFFSNRTGKLLESILTSEQNPSSEESSKLNLA